jgi:tRNA A-37 threonylcarbamoyl transferase component Bud32/tetratricopeptide (TPR) repeat protein
VHCLDDNVVGAYLTNTLPESDRRRVVDHLSACDTCLTLVCAASRGQGEAPVEPERVDRYELVEMIGRGGMGSVYVAHDPQLGRKIALKIVRSTRFEHDDVRARLSREARAMAQVRHPNVVAVYDAGELDGGVFIAMELVEGETLARWLAERPRTWREIVRVFTAAGAGLVAAHAAGIVHRDFKPENVLVDRAGRVAVTDFGLAAIPAPEDDGTATAANLLVTRSGMLRGTPRYMAPEQFRGEPAAASSDQFSFAVAFYEALYREAPFAGETVEELSRAVAAGELRPPPADRLVPRRVRRAVVRALAVAPGARFPAMTTLLAALEKTLRPRWRTPTIALGTAALVIVAALAILVRPARPLPPMRAIGAPRTALFVGRFDNRTGDLRLDDTLDLAVVAVAYSSTQLDPVAGAELISVARRVQGDAANVDALADLRAAVDPRPILVAHGRVERAGAGYVVSLDVRDRGATVARFAASRPAARLDDVVPATTRLAAAMLETLGDPPVPASATNVLSRSVAAIHAWSDGQRHALDDDLQSAIIEYRRAIELDPEFAEARSSLGLALYDTSDRAGAITELERAFQAADQIPERQRLGLMGDYYGTAGRYSDAIMAYQQLLAKWPGDARTQVNLTATALDANSWPLALEVARGALQAHPDLEIVRRNFVIAELGNELLADGHRDAAELVATARSPSGIAIALLASSAILIGDRAAAPAALAKLSTVEPDLAPRATADLALYEGRLDDALAALRGASTPPEQVVTARVLLRRGDRAGALAAATAGLADTTLPDEYLAASLAIDAGGTSGMADKARAWTAMPETDRRMFGKLLEGDVARAEQRPRDAIAAYEEAGRIGASWLVHERLARAQLAAGEPAAAEHELEWCLAHRGQAAMLSNPSLELLSEVYLELARSEDARHADIGAVRAAYQAVVQLAPAPQHDPWTDEARRRLAVLSR